MSKKSVVTVADVMAKLAQLPSDMEVWHTWDESGESAPIVQASFESTEFSPGWLKPTTVVRRRRVGKLRYEELLGGDHKKCRRTTKTVVIV